MPKVLIEFTVDEDGMQSLDSVLRNVQHGYSTPVCYTCRSNEGFRHGTLVDGLIGWSNQIVRRHRADRGHAEVMFDEEDRENGPIKSARIVEVINEVR